MSEAPGPETPSPRERDPFPGPKPLQAGDRLYGRDHEVLQLHDLLVAHRIVLLYSPSGAGKSSLLEAGLRPTLEADGFRVVGQLRVGPASGTPGGGQPNPYVQAVLAGLGVSAPPEDVDPGPERLRTRFATLEGESEGKPLVLIFDQFEELLTSTVGDDLAEDDRIRAEFLQELGEALRDRSRWAVFAMREDHIASLDPFLHLLPTQLSTRFRIDLLRHDEALEAVKGPVSQTRPFRDEAAEELVTDLRRVRLPRPEGGFVTRPGRFVEPLHLQLVCRQLWIDTAGRVEIGVEDVRRSTTDASSVERALTDYYSAQVGAIGKEQHVSERRLRDWFDRQLIIGEHRGRTLEGPMGAAPPEDPLLQRLVGSHLVRMSTSGDATWYELAHDRLIDPVGRSNRDWRWRHGGRLLRQMAVAVVVVLVLIAVAGIWWLRREVDYADSVARSALLAQRSSEQLAISLDLALLLGSEAVIASQDLDPQDRFAASNALLTALQTEPALSSFLRGHTGSVRSVALGGPDGKTVASGSADGTVILWDATTGERIGAPLTGHTGPVLSVAFGGDGGRTLAAGGADGTVILWDVPSGEQVGSQLTGRPGPVFSVAFGGDGGRTLAAGGADGTVTVWDTSSGERVGELVDGHKGPVLSVAMGGTDGETIASGGADGSVVLWDVTTGRPVRGPLLGHRGAVNAVALGGADGVTLASGGSDGTVILWDAATGERIGEPLTGHTGPVLGVALVPDGRAVAAAGSDGTVIIWDPATGERIGEPLTGHTGAVNAVALGSDGRTVVSGGRDSAVILWDTARPDPIARRLTAHEGAVNAVAIGGPDGGMLASGGRDGQVIVWDVATGEPIGEPLTDLEEAVNAVSIGGPDGMTIAAGGADGTIILWDLATRQTMGEPLTGHAGPVLSVAISPDGRIVAGGGVDGTIRLWDSTTGVPIGAPLETHAGPVQSVAFTSDGRTLASGGGDRSVILWDVKTAEPIGDPLTGHSGAVNAVAFGGPNGRTLVSGGADGTVIRWDLTTGQGESLTTQNGPVLGLDLGGPEMRLLASGGADARGGDGVVMLRDVATGERVGEPLTGHTGAILSVAVGPAWTSVASGGADGSIIVWDLGAASWIDRACDRANRNLSEDEWRRYLPNRSYHPTCSGLPAGSGVGAASPSPGSPPSGVPSS